MVDVSEFDALAVDPMAAKKIKHVRPIRFPKPYRFGLPKPYKFAILSVIITMVSPH